MRQSSAPAAATGAGTERVQSSDRRDEREQSALLYVGLAGALGLTSGLWILRGWIGRVSLLELVAGAMMLLGTAAVVWVLTALVLLATRVDRASEEVSTLLDSVASGKLTSRIAAPRGLGREARLAGAATAALNRLRGWVEGVRSSVSVIRKDLDAAVSATPRLRDAFAQNSQHVQLLTRDSQFLASSAEEQAALTQRACVLASLIGQSHRDTAAFAERIHNAVRDAASALSECAARTADLRAVMTKQEEESAHCLEADRQLSEYLIVVAKSARQFKLLALHAAMEAARAGARSDSVGIEASEGRGAEFRVVALEVRRLALDLGKATDDITRLVEGARRSLQAFNGAAVDGGRHIEAAQGAVSLGVSALDHATTAASARRLDDATLAEAGTELTILTSAIRERATGFAKGSGDIADRLLKLDQSLASAADAAREMELSLQTAMASVARSNEVIGTMVTSMATSEPVLPAKPVRKKRAPRGAPARPARVQA